MFSKILCQGKKHQKKLCHFLLITSSILFCPICTIIAQLSIIVARNFLTNFRRPKREWMNEIYLQPEKPLCFSLHFEYTSWQCFQSKSLCLCVFAISLWENWRFAAAGKTEELSWDLKKYIALCVCFTLWVQCRLSWHSDFVLYTCQENND